MSTTLVGQVPFKTAFIHGLVRDKLGRKFSKSLNNGIDPKDMIAKYGTDALRVSLVFSAAPGNDVAFDEQKIKGMKHFANKLWNIARFVITSLEASGELSIDPELDGEGRVASGDLKTKNYQLETLTDADKDILEKLNILIRDTTGHLENYRLHEAAQGLYQFTWHEFADVYIEAAKVQLQDEALKINTYNLLTYILTTVLHLLHPFMPFITEYIWGLLDERGLRKTHDPLLISKWPKTDK
jgi:valyl-tRNA synthetase